MLEKTGIRAVLQEHDDFLFVGHLVQLGERGGGVGLGALVTGPALGYGQTGVVVGFGVMGAVGT
jgi:hypothetical protein